ncbi:family 2 glycosyl transferase [Hyphomicrobium denitrificans 1NES1]|uniref:Family 2 glycosyl transferase n=1 Tax=Hyphomicrobium denitrificans 1NES1 TaxID=670307 RepID=N0B274_9HYPH|nr:glycosyltransferase family 2 protein [Hyphomicrobium denitrificans]AGK57584.1 family 2 glycosyl transferase [Hyphomicrobium denitrificans 1NES1]
MSIVLMLANVVLLVLTAAMLVPVATLASQIACGRSRQRQIALPNGDRPAVAVLIPAHNEAAGIEQTLSSIREQLRSFDRLIVIADNCTDDTASVATRAGAEVVERNNLDRIGKGYALDAGFKYLDAPSAPSVVIFVDADCTLSAGAIDALAWNCTAKDRPIQGIYLMNTPADADSAQRLAAFAWRVKNMVRLLGFHALGMPCLLTGAGMAIPSHVLRKIDLASGHITEDTLITVNCAFMGYPPALCPEATISSDFAPTEAGRSTQKKRWMHGHLSAITEFVPKLIVAAYQRRDIQLLALAADIAVPPLGLLLAGLIVLAFACFVWLLATGYSGPLALALIGLLLTGATLIAAWFKAGRDLIGISELREVARYARHRLSIAKDFVMGHRSQWTRSERGR